MGEATKRLMPKELLPLHSLLSNQLTAWWLSTLLLKNGQNWEASRPKLLVLLWHKQLPVQVSSMTNTAVFMLETQIHTKSLLRYSIPSLKNTMAFHLASSIHPTWTLEKFKATLSQLLQSKASEFVSAEASMVSAFLLELLGSKGLLKKP